ncbi:hypothetical protein [Sulfuracidifex tepidarius]|uniref:hypothetical protein n=1 Tax=Sulfuracidifex tepidarius TaxID=1294262 RepID=UPI00138EE3ED|nr:hypothetical protein [Sulfuracidifex tepidarius]
MVEAFSFSTTAEHDIKGLETILISPSLYLMLSWASFSSVSLSSLIVCVDLVYEA